jgi:hypothetical protein
LFVRWVRGCLCLRAAWKRWKLKRILNRNDAWWSTQLWLSLASWCHHRKLQSSFFYLLSVIFRCHFCSWWGVREYFMVVLGAVRCWVFWIRDFLWLSNG